MTLELVSEEVDSAVASSLYPFNALRNHALLLVKTEVNPHQDACCFTVFKSIACTHQMQLTNVACLVSPRSPEI